MFVPHTTLFAPKNIREEMFCQSFWSGIAADIIWKVFTGSSEI